MLERLAEVFPGWSPEKQTWKTLTACLNSHHSCILFGAQEKEERGNELLGKRQKFIPTSGVEAKNKSPT